MAGQNIAWLEIQAEMRKEEGTVERDASKPPKEQVARACKVMPSQYADYQKSVNSKLIC